MITDETKPSDFTRPGKADLTKIIGWGVDINKDNDPTYPIKKRTDEEQEGYVWRRPPQQAQTSEILKSVERPNLTAVYGSPVPPSGVSGAIRRVAYKYSESSYGRWLPLMLADRVGVVEGIVTDLAHGHIPNLYDELGLAAEWKYNRKKFVAKVAVGAIVTGLAIAFLYQKKKKKKATY